MQWNVNVRKFKKSFWNERNALIPDDKTDKTKKKNDELVSKMLKNGEISDKVAKYLVKGQTNLSKFYYLLKTHKIPCSVENPGEWLDENGYPLRGIISGRGAPT